MIRSSNIQYTRNDLNELYKYEQTKIRRNSINKITDHLCESVIKKATQGGSFITEYFPKNKFSELQNEVLIKMKTIFPDSEIMIKELVVDSSNSIAITIDWGL